MDDIMLMLMAMRCDARVFPFLSLSLPVFFILYFVYMYVCVWMNLQTPSSKLQTPHDTSLS